MTQVFRQAVFAVILSVIVFVAGCTPARSPVRLPAPNDPIEQYKATAAALTKKSIRQGDVPMLAPGSRLDVTREIRVVTNANNTLRLLVPVKDAGAMVDSLAWTVNLDSGEVLGPTGLFLKQVESLLRDK